MCTETIAKIVLIVLNILFFIGGAAILTVGIIAYVKEDLLYSITELLTDKLGVVFSDLKILTDLDLFNLIKNNAIILIAVGAFLFILGFLGCCGAMKKSSCMLNMYAILVLVILATEVGLGVYAYMYSDKLESQIQDGLDLALHKSYKEGARFTGSDIVIATDAKEIAWDAVQFETACCGVSAQTDWADVVQWNKVYTVNGVSTTAVVPPSCCLRTDAGKAKTDFTKLTTTDFKDLNGCMTSAMAGTYNDLGCYQRLRDIVFDNQKLIISIFVIIVIIEILAISFSCYLKNQADKK